MSFASLAQPAVLPLIERVAGADDLTLLVGAGASMEAGLPSWKGLIEALLDTVAEGRAELDSPAARDRWKELTLERDDLLGAGAVVEVLADEPLDELVPRQLYGAAGPSGYQPGPIAHEVARLRAGFGDRAEILTTNYDDLIEQALIEGGVAASRLRSYRTYRNPENRAADTVAVTHLHGLAGRSEEARSIVLTEEHYHRMQRGSSWQERFVTERLERSTCLFVGMSLADPNLIRYLYGYKVPDETRHAAIFVRQGEPTCPAPVRALLEEAAAKRWGRCGVEAIFVDHFADAAQLLYEIRHRRESGEAYEPIEKRARQKLELAERGLAVSDKQSVFAERQTTFSGGLRLMLESLVDRVVEAGIVERDAGESLGAALWLFTPDGSGLVGWAHSDRAHQDPSTLAPVPIEADSKWVAVRAVCRGVRVELDRDNYASRWRFVRALPLVLEEPSRIPVGCLTVSSTRTAAESVLTRMPDGVQAAFHQTLSRTGISLAQLLIVTGEGKFDELSK
jgi:hypothetical protein